MDPRNESDHLFPTISIKKVNFRDKYSWARDSKDQDGWMRGSTDDQEAIATMDPGFKLDREPDVASSTVLL